MSKTKHSVIRKLGILFLLLFICLQIQVPSAVHAASKPAKITSCKLISADKIEIKATISKLSSVKGKKVYLFALPVEQSTPSASDKPLLSKSKKKSVSFTVSLNKNSSDSNLYRRFILAAKNGKNSWQIISNGSFISNPSKTAKYKYKFPTAASKKGLQVSASMLEDAAELNISHSAINIVFTEMISAPSEQNENVSVPYKYHGKTYWFRRSAINGYDRQLKAMLETNTTVSAILLLGWRDDLTHLIYPSGREPGHSFYAWNTAEKESREQLQAALSFLASRYSTKTAKNGRIVNWIVGNEVNNYKVYNYAGEKTLSQYASIYANAFRLTYNTVAGIYANARVYISLDHLWNTTWVNGTFASRSMLDTFAKKLKNHGSIPWNLAFHPYNSPLTEPNFWKNTSWAVTDSLTSPAITMKNIHLLTSYIRKQYGSSTRIILSEQGYTSVRHNTNTSVDAQKEQAAAIAYSYYLTESNDMIDSFIMNRHVDHDVEIAQGLDLGLWTTDTSSGNPEWADTKKTSWEVFKYMDTNRSESVTKSSLSVIGISNWSKAIKNFKPALYNKISIASAAMKLPDRYQKTAALTSNWKSYGAALTHRLSGNKLLTIRDAGRNRNSLWGFSQDLAKKVSFHKHPWFYTTVKINGATTQKVWLKIRFFSGTRILESSALVDTGRDVPVGVSLANWKYRKSVTKIQILLAPANGSWTNQASFEMTLPVRGRS